MWKLRVFLSAFVVVLLGLPALAQEGGDIGIIGCMDAMPGKSADLEAAAKAHNKDFHGKQGDDWTWVAWQVTSGPQVGRYCWGSFGHSWADFDSAKISRKADSADWGSRTAGLTQNVWLGYTRFLSGVSQSAEEAAPMSEVTFFQVRFGKGAEFQEVIGKFHEAIVKTKMPWNYEWYASVNGDQAGTFVLVFPLENFAAMAPGDKSFVDVLNEAYGKKEASALLDRFNSLVEKSWNAMDVNRPDLSYFPE